MNELERVRAAYPPLHEGAPPTATIARLRMLYASPTLGRSTVNLRTGAQAPERLSGRVRRRRARRVGFLAAGAVIVSGTAVAATGSWPALLGSGGGDRPAAAGDRVPASQRAVLAVLRRPQVPSDRGPVVQSALRHLDRRFINGVHVDGIRVVYREPREVTVLVPAQRYGRRVTNVPSSLSMQRDVLCLMSSSYQPARIWRVSAQGKPTTVRLRAGFRDWGVACRDLATLLTTGIQTGTSPGSTGGLVTDGHLDRLPNRRITLVPDGVAQVKVRLRGGRSVIVPTIRNIYVYTVRGASASLGTTWFDAAGKKISRPMRP